MPPPRLAKLPGRSVLRRLRERGSAKLRGDDAAGGPLRSGDEKPDDACDAVAPLPSPVEAPCRPVADALLASSGDLLTSTAWLEETTACAATKMLGSVLPSNEPSPAWPAASMVLEAARVTPRLP